MLVKTWASAARALPSWSRRSGSGPWTTVSPARRQPADLPRRVQHYVEAAAGASVRLVSTAPSELRRALAAFAGFGGSDAGAALGMGRAKRGRCEQPRERERLSRWFVVF